MESTPLKLSVIAALEQHLREERASAPPEKTAELDRLLLMYRFLPRRIAESGEPAAPGTLVRVRLNAGTGSESYCLIVPSGGGMVTRVENQVVQVLTPQSPLGSALLGRRAGESARVESGGVEREYAIVSVE